MAAIDEEYVAVLVRRAQTKDSDAFAELYALTYERQYRFARKYLHDPDDAWDAVQEVFMLALRKLQTLRDPRYLQTWLTQINARVCYDMQQANRRNAGVVWEGDTDDPLAQLPDASVSADPELSLMQDAETQAVRRAVEQLPEKERRAIRLKYRQGLSLQQIAEELGCSISSVTRYLSQAHRQVKSKLEQEEGQ